MQAQRVILQTDDQGHIKRLPPFPPRARIEATFLVLDGSCERTIRTPPPQLAAMTRICSDLVPPAVDAEDWEALQ